MSFFLPYCPDNNLVLVEAAHDVGLAGVVHHAHAAVQRRRDRRLSDALCQVALPFDVGAAFLGEDVLDGAGAQFNRKHFWLQFRLEKSLEFWLEIPHNKKMFKNG